MKAIVLLMLGLAVAVPLVPSRAQPPAEPTTDSRVKTAEFAKQALEKSEKEVSAAAAMSISESLAELEKAVEAMRPGNLQDEQQTLAAFRAVVPKLRALAKDILGKERLYKEKLAVYRKELANAAPAFKQAAEVFEQRATEEELPQFQEKLRRLASNMRDQAAVMQQRAAELAAGDNEVEEAHKYISAADRYLASFSEWLTIYPELGSGIEREKHIEEIRSFLKHFQQMERAFQGFQQKLKPQASIRKEHLRTLALAEKARLLAEEVRNTTRVEYASDNFAGIFAGRDRGLYLGQVLAVHRNGMPVGQAVVDRVESDTSVLRFHRTVVARVGDTVSLPSTKGRYFPATVEVNLPGLSKPPLCSGRPVNVHRNGLAKTSLK